MKKITAIINKVINDNWRKESNGQNNLQLMLNGKGGGPSNGPGAGGTGSRGNVNSKAKATKAVVNWGRIGHIAKEAAMYGTGADYGRMR